MIYIIILYAILGFTITLSKILLTYASPVFLVGIRMLIAGICLLAYVYIHQRKDVHLNRHDWILILQFTFFGILIPHVARAWALQYLPTVKAALIFNFAPFFSAIFGYFLVRERISLVQLCGLAIGFLGLIPLFLNQRTATTPLSHLFTRFSIPDIVILIAVASLSYSLFIMQRLVKERRHSPFLINGASMLLAGIIACNGSLVEPTWIKGNFAMFSALLAVNIFASNFICSNLQAWLLKKHSSIFMSFANILSPIFAAMYSWLLLNERISVHILLAFIFVLSGLGIYFYDGLRASRRATA